MKFIFRIFCILLFFIINNQNIYSQNKKNKILIDQSNAHKLTGDKEMILKNNRLISLKKGFKIIAGFKNNPYQLDGSYKIMLILNRNIIYDGIYTNYGFESFVPIEQLNKKVMPRLIVYKKNKYYIFNCDEAQKTITPKDNMIHVIFMPTNDSESIYFISTNWKLNEN